LSDLPLGHKLPGLAGFKFKDMQRKSAGERATVLSAPIWPAKLREQNIFSPTYLSGKKKTDVAKKTFDLFSGQNCRGVVVKLRAKWGRNRNKNTQAFPIMNRGGMIRERIRC
jgi:hypothetical protein